MALFTLLTAGAWTGWNTYDDYRNALNQEYTLLEVRARHREARITGALRSIDLMLSTLGEDLIERPDMSPRELNRLLRERMRQLPETRNILLTDALGRVVAATNDAILDFDASQREYFTEVRDGAVDHTHISRPFRTVTGITVVTVSYGVRTPSGRFLGAISATIDPLLFGDILRFRDPTPDGNALLIHERGDIVYGSPNPEAFVGKNLVGGTGYTEHMARAQPTTRHLNTTKNLGKKVVAVFHRVPETPLIVVVSRDYRTVLADWRQSMLAHAAGYLLVACVVFFLTGLAGRRQASLVRANAFSQHLIDSASVMIVGLDTRGHVVIFNTTAETISGYARDEIVGKNWFEVAVPRQRFPEVWDEFNRIQASGVQATTFENPIVAKDGSVRTIAWRNTILNDDDGIATVSFGLDITDRIRAESELAQALALNHSIVSESPIGIALFRADGPCVLVNQAFADNVGGRVEVIRGFNFRRMETWRTSGLLDAALDALEHDRVVHKEVHATTAFGKTVWLDCKLTPLTLDGVRHLLLMNFDIADVRAAEEALRTAMSLAEQSNRAKSEFLANMSHEIRTPMNAVIGMSQLALDAEPNARIADYLHKIYGASKSLLGILNDILDYSKIEAGQVRIENSAFSLDDTLDSVRDLHAASADQKGIDFDIDIADDLPVMLTGDSLRLTQVLNNLTGNAIKFTERGAVYIEVRLRKHDEQSARIAFAVHDSGIGMTPDQQSSLFQPFVQADGSITRRFGGTGLGLVISRRLLQMMGSDLEVGSEAGRGSTFRFELDFGIPAEWREVHREPRGAPTLDQLPRTLAGRHILVVEDNATNALVAREFLAKAGCTAVVADNGEAALRCLAADSFDAVLMDIHMPVMDGLEATRRIRAVPAWTDLPIVALTASVLVEDRESCLAAGMNDHLPKPLDPHRLVEVLAHLLDGHPCAKATAAAPRGIPENSEPHIADQPSSQHTP